MPFTAPLLHSAGSPYRSQILFSPNPGVGSVGDIYIYKASIVVVSDLDDYFDNAVEVVPGDNMVPFAVLQQYTFTLIENTLNSVSSNIQSMKLVEYDSSTSRAAEDPIMTLYTNSGGNQTPSPVTYTPDATGLNGLAVEIYANLGGQRTISGSVRIGIQAT